MSGRPVRSTRGKRARELNPDEVEADAKFWGQAQFQEDDNDGDYEQAEVVQEGEVEEALDEEGDAEKGGGAADAEVGGEGKRGGEGEAREGGEVVDLGTDLKSEDAEAAKPDKETAEVDEVSAKTEGQTANGGTKQESEELEAK